MQSVESTAEPQNDGLEIWEKGQVIVEQHKIIRRISFTFLFSESAKIFNLEKGFFHTAIELTKAPAATIKAYMDTRRYEFTNPVKYLLIISGLTIFVGLQNGFFEMQDAAAAQEENVISGDRTVDSERETMTAEQVTQVLFAEVWQNYYVNYQNIWNIFSILFTSFFSYLFFRKSGYNYAENLAINTYIFGHTYIIFLVIVLIKPSAIWSSIYLLCWVAYMAIVFRGIFRQSWWKSSVKSVLVALISSSIYMIIIAALLLIWVFFNREKVGL